MRSVLLLVGCLGTLGCSRSADTVHATVESSGNTQTAAGIRTTTGDQAPLPMPEDIPPGVSFSDTASEPERLAVRFRATLAWRDPDGARLYVRIEDNPANSEPSFHVNRAYYVRRNTTPFWAFLDAASMQDKDFQDPAVQFMLRRHVGDTVRPSARRGDGNRSSVSLLARRSDGAAVYRIVYASLGGERSGQEEMRTYLLYRSDSGQWQLGTYDIAGSLGEGSSRLGWIGISHNTELQVVWTPGAIAPFRADLKTITSHYEGREGTTPSYDFSRAGVLDGALPLQLRMSDRLIYEPDSAYSIGTLAGTITTYHSGWVTASWIASPADARRQVEEAWIQAIQRLNPGIGAGDILSPETRIELPDPSATARTILEQLRDRLSARADTIQNATRQLRALASEVAHFATDDIIANRWIDRRWPPELLRQQENLLAALEAMGSDRDAVRAALGDANPRVRTLALGALFVREDPRDLPLIAALQHDSAATLTDLHMSPTSQMGPLPLHYFESPQTVGSVATRMIRFYLDAASDTSSFEQYWTERGSRARSAGWFLARMRRATRQTTPLQPRYEADVSRVLADINALPPVERAWTLLYMRPGLAGTEKDHEAIVPESTLVAALKEVGPDALMKFIRRQPATDDPDVRPELGNSPRAGMTYGMIAFILNNAVELLRPSDADAVLAEATRDPVYTPTQLWIGATAQLRGLTNMAEAVSWLKEQIADVPRTIVTPRHQALLTTTLWRMRGSAEREYFTNWFYSVLPGAQVDGVHGPLEFLRGVQRYAREDRDSLLAAIVSDARFEDADWGVIAELLHMLNAERGTPLVENRTIYDYRPPRERPDQRATLERWRQLLRQHFGRV